VICTQKPEGIELCDPHNKVITSLPKVGKAYPLQSLLAGKEVPGNILLDARPYRKANAKPPNPLKVQYYSQLDSTTGHAYRMCFSSCCAMLLNYLRPGKLHGANGDDQYLNEVLKYGDTTESNAQISALKSYGLDAQFRQDLTWENIDSQLAKGKPVPIGILFQGPLSAPSGGHWIIIVGFTSTGYIVHDPYGELDLINGTYNNNVSGAYLEYSKKNLGLRWMVGGTKGWGIIA